MPEVSEPRPSEVWHEFCGPHAIRGATSPNSGQPLQCILKLNLTDSRLNLGDLELHTIPLLFSWTCEISQAPIYYQLISDTEIEILRFKSGAAYDDFPYPGYPDYFPKRLVSLVALTIEEQTIIRGVNRRQVDKNAVYKQRPNLCRPERQIGGEPFLVQPWIELSCPRCACAMPFLASVGDDNGSERGFTGNPFVQTIFSLCMTCRIVGAYQQSD
jgi:hypothetical protein